MGYFKDKYTRNYFLMEDVTDSKTISGVEGVEEFKSGGIREHDREILNRLDFRNMTVLDLGFGRGEAIKYALDNKASKVVGVDFSKDANVIVKDYLAQYGLHADLYCMDVLDFFNKYSEKKDCKVFDIVLMLDIVEHVPRSELTIVFKELKKWMSNKSILAINTPIFQADNDVISDGLDPRTIHTTEECKETEGMHCNLYTKVSLKKYMFNSGFTSISGHYFTPTLTILKIFNGTLFSRIKAILLGYPINYIAIWKKERFEYAMSWEQIRKNQNSFKELLSWTAKNKPRSLFNILYIHRSQIILAILNRLFGYSRLKK